MKTPRNLHEYFQFNDVEKLLEMKDALHALKNNPNFSEKSAELRASLEEIVTKALNDEAVQKKNPFERK